MYNKQNERVHGICNKRGMRRMRMQKVSECVRAVLIVEWAGSGEYFKEKRYFIFPQACS